MLGMITPTVTELPLRLEPVAADTFAGDPVRLVRHSVECDQALPQRRRDRAGTPRRRSRLRSALRPARHHPVLAA
jgi:hypothetical protein